MKKKVYIKPEIEELEDCLSIILAASTTPETPDPGLGRQQDNTFAEDDDDNDELFQVFYSEGIGVKPHTAQPHRGTDPL